MEGTLNNKTKSRLLWKSLLIAAVVILTLILAPPIERAVTAWADPEARLERLQERTAHELRRYYEGAGNWLRCHRLLQRLERLEQRGQ